MAYITYVGKHMKAVHCKRCRVLIAGRRGIAQNLRIDRTHDYDVLVLEMLNPDGQIAKHETPMCRDCAQALRVGVTSREELARLYAEDMEQHYLSTILAGYPKDEVKKMVARFDTRVPLRALDERARGM